MSSLPAGADARFEQLRCLTEISRALTYTTATEEVLSLATSRAAALMDAESALLMLADDTGAMRIRAAHGVAQDVLERVPDRLDESLVHRLQAALGAPMPGAFLGVPLVAAGSVIGLLAVVRRDGNEISEEEEWILSAVADQVAVALENARLEEELRRQREVRAREVEGAEEIDGAHNRALATLSHDLRSPLNAIDSYAELMEMEILGPIVDRQREALGRIRLSGRHLLAVLENVLEMARINAGVVRVNPTTVRMVGVVEEAVLLIRPGAAAKNQTVLVDSASNPVVTADADRLRQALVNLLGNAVKYTQPGGTIRAVTAMREAGDRRWGEIRIVDNGPGIPADKLQSVFNPYYRIASSGDTSPEGTGLGLAISRELVRRMGGDIVVESEMGRGSTFAVRLPIAAA